MLVPAMQSMGTCISSSTLSTPTCAPPFAPPPASTNPMRGRPFVLVCWACAGGDAAASKSNAETSAANARTEAGNVLRIMPANLVLRRGRRHKHWGLETVTDLQHRPECLHVIDEAAGTAAMVIV